MGQRLVVIGEIARPHGLRGEMRVTPLTDRPERFADVTDCVLWDRARDIRESCRVTGARRQGAAVLISLAGCETVEAAAALVGRLVALPEAEALPLPPGRFYPWQLEGCSGPRRTCGW
jgi:16S rRNA processing protein RimM